MICGQSGITFIGGIALLVSAMIGPGLVTIPILFESAGWITPLIMFSVTVVLACSSSLLLIEALSSIPGNERFQKKIEYISLFNKLIDNGILRIVIYLILFLSIESMIIATIALTSQLFDAMLIRFTGGACGIGIYPDGGWICVQNLGDFSSPFGDRWMAVTSGFMITFIIVLPMTFCDLGENVKVQIVSFVTLTIVIITWIITCIMNGLKADRIPLIGRDHSLLIGTVLFNYTFITTVPSMVNDLNRDVPIRKLIWISVGIATLTYISIGTLGAMAFHYDLSSNIISEIRHSKIRNVFTDIATFLFSLCGLLTSIPVDTIVVRYNLVRSGVCKNSTATFISLAIPWCIALSFQTGSWLNLFTNWASLLFISTANFVLPFWLFYLSQRKAKTLQTLELAREAALIAESNEKPFHQFNYTHSFHSNDNIQNNRNHVNHNNDNNDNNDNNITSHYFTREPISLPPPPPRPQPHSSTSTETPAYQKHLEKHLQKLKLENPQLEKLKRPKMYRNMSADAVPIDELPDILNDKISNIITQTEVYETDRSIVPSHPSTPRSASTDDDEFYHLFNYSGGKPFKAFPGTNKNFSMIVSFSAASVSIILISGMIVYDFIGLANGRNYFDLDPNT